MLLAPLLIILGGSGLEGCRFTPTCSHYSEISFKRFGFFRGFALSLGRILRCHPWHRSSYIDWPPEGKSLA